jgi:hypothetical protein
MPITHTNKQIHTRNSHISVFTTTLVGRIATGWGGADYYFLAKHSVEGSSISHYYYYFPILFILFVSFFESRTLTFPLFSFLVSIGGFGERHEVLIWVLDQAWRWAAWKTSAVIVHLKYSELVLPVAVDDGRAYCILIMGYDCIDGQCSNLGSHWACRDCWT